MSFLAERTIPNKLKYIINKLKIGKSSGYDIISNKILLNLYKKNSNTPYINSQLHATRALLFIFIKDNFCNNSDT